MVHVTFSLFCALFFIVVMSLKKVNDKDGCKRKKRMMTMELKREIVGKHECGVRVRDLARMYDRSTSMICSVLKKKDVIKNVNPSKGVTIISKLRSNINDEMERLLLLWIKEKQMSGDIITETFIREKASVIYDDLKLKEAAEKGETSTPGEPFKASRGWFDNFRKRTGIHSVVRHGEAAEEYFEHFAPLVEFEGYVPEQAFNCDETGVFLGKMPQRTFIMAEENKLPGHKPMNKASGDCKATPLAETENESAISQEEYDEEEEKYIIPTEITTVWDDQPVNSGNDSQSNTAETVSPPPTQSAGKSDLEMSVLRRQERVLELQEEYYSLKIKCLKDKLAKESQQNDKEKC